MDEKSIVVDYDVFYIDPNDNSGMKPGWYFWFLDQHGSIVSEPIGPFADADEVLRSGRLAVKVYYDDNEA